MNEITCASVTVVVTSVCHSSKVAATYFSLLYFLLCIQLWEQDPHTMKKALVVTNEVIQQSRKRNLGYEIKSNGESFLFLFCDPIAAAQFCLEIQTELVEAEWSSELLKLPEASIIRYSVK